MSADHSPRSGLRAILIAAGALGVLTAGCLLILYFGFTNWQRISTESRPLRSANERIADANRPVVYAAVTATAEPLMVVATPAGGVDYESAVLMNIYSTVNPSVVNITGFGSADTLNSLAPHNFEGDELLPLGTGSGFIWDREGHIVTNHHVVENASELQVTFSDGLVAVATIVGYDVSSDLAVLKIDPEGYNLLPVRRGKMAEVRVGMRVAAIGNPFGLAGTLTSGIVSALGRSIPAQNFFNIPSSIQTDAAINPGNSGGPLLNEAGEVIGVNAQIRSSERANSGVGFAIPIALVERVAPALIAEGSYQHSYLGVRGATLSPLCADDLGLAKRQRGAYVTDVIRNTPAERAGLQGGSGTSASKYTQICPGNVGGDVILAIADQAVTSFDDVLVYLEYNTSPGDSITLHILRDGKELDLEVTLGTRPESANG